MQILGKIAVLFLMLQLALPGSLSATAVRAGREVPPPKLIRMVSPQLPKDRRGEPLPFLILELKIDKRGAVSAVTVLKSNNSRLNALALAAIREWRYQPTVYRGKTVDVLYNITFSYEVR